MKRVVMVLLPVAAAAAWLMWHAGGSNDGANRTSSEHRAAARAGFWSGARPDGVGGGARVGDQRVYQLHTTRVIEVSRRGAAPQVVEVGLRGQWVTAVVARGDHDALVRVQLRDPSLELDDRAGQLSAADRAATEAQLTTPFYVRFSDTGQVDTIYLREQLDGFARAALHGLVAASQYVEPDGAGDTWETEESDTTGVYAGRYQRSPDGRVVKTNLGYVRLATAGGMVPLEHIGALDSDGHAEFAIGRDRGIEHLDGNDRLVIETAQPPVTIATRATWQLDLIRAETVAVADPAPSLSDGWKAYTLGDSTLAGDQQRTADQRLLAGADFDQLLAELDRALAGDDGTARALALQRWAALLRVDPSTAERLPAVIAAADSTATGEILIGALETAGNTGSQAALRQLAGATDIESLNRLQSIAALGSVPDPDPGTVAALRGLTGDADQEIAATASLALGALAGSRGALDPAEADRIADQLVRRLAQATTPDEQILYLEALGNTRDPRVRPAIEAQLSSRWPQVRGAATRALRFFAGTDVDARLLAILRGDDNQRVRADALFAFSYRPLTPLLPVFQSFLAGEPVAGLRREAVVLVGSYLPELADRQSVVQVLAWAAENDADPSVREAAQGFL